MTPPPPRTSLLDELEARQDDLIRRLDELDERIRRTMAEVTGSQGEAACATGK